MVGKYRHAPSNTSSFNLPLSPLPFGSPSPYHPLRAHKQKTGHDWIGEKVCRKFEGPDGVSVCTGVCVAWVPADHDAGDQALWHIKHNDGDEEDLDEDEMIDARKLWQQQQRERKKRRRDKLQEQQAAAVRAKERKRQKMREKREVQARRLQKQKELARLQRKQQRAQALQNKAQG